MDDKDLNRTAKLKTNKKQMSDEISVSVLVRGHLKEKGERHFDVQILGGIVLHKVKLKMKTGEAKLLQLLLYI